MNPNDVSAPRLAAILLLLLICASLGANRAAAMPTPEWPDQGCPETHEPNDTLAGAWHVRPNRGVVYSAICPRTGGYDDDWFSFDVPSTDTINVVLGEPPADYDIKLYNPSGVDVAASVNPGFASESITYSASTAGRWAVHVYAKEGASSASPYPLDIEVGSYPNNCNEWFEPNDGFGDAVTISTGQSYDGYVCDPWDEDWFKFAVSAGDDVTIDMYNLPADYDLRLHSGSQQSIGTSQNSGTSSEHIEVTAASADVYRLQIKGYAGAHHAGQVYSVQVDIGAGGSGCGEWFEPNESFEAAAAIQPGMSYDGFICDADDLDWFKFPVTIGDDVTVDLYNLPVDYDVRVYDPSGSLIGDSENGGVIPERVEFTAGADGDYAIYVFGYGDVYDPDHTYSVQAQVVPSAGGCGEWFEPNESISESKPLTAGLSQDGYICDDQDVDFFYVTVETGNEITAHLSNLPDDYDLEMFDPSGDSVGESRSSGTSDETINHTALADGNYYIEISGYQGASSQSSVYQVVMNVRTTPPTCGDYFEPNERFEDAAPLTSGLPQAGHICTAADVEWFRFGAQSGQEIVVELYTLPADYDLRIYDPAGALVGESAGGGTAIERIEIVAASTGDYRAYVFGYGGVFDPVNTYTVEATVSDVGVTPTNTATPTRTQVVPTSTATPTLTPKPQPTSTVTRTSQPKPTATSTHTATTVVATATATETRPPKPTSTATATLTPKPSATNTLLPPTPTATQSPSSTVTATATGTTGPTATATAEPTFTQAAVEPTGTAGATASLTPTVTPTGSVAAPATATMTVPAPTPSASGTPEEPSWTIYVPYASDKSRALRR